MARYEPYLTCTLGLLALALGGLYIFCGSRRQTARIIAVMLVLLAGFGTWQYFEQGKLHGWTRKRSNIHMHEFMHYVLGSKYFKQVRYTGLYHCLALALRELSNEQAIPKSIHVEAIRNLADKRGYVHGEKIYEEAAVFRQRFSDKEWERFKSDLAYLVRLAPSPDWAGMLRDAGYNSSPVYTLFAHSVARLLPLRTFVHVLSCLDVVILTAVIVLLWRTMGAVPALVGLCVIVYYPGASYSTYNWTGGSFMRHGWLLWLTLAWVALYHQRLFRAGVFFAVTALERVFPLFFFLGACWYVFVARRDNWSRVKGWRDVTLRDVVAGIASRQSVWRLAAGFLLSSGLLFAITCLLFGADMWLAFFEHILEHAGPYFTNHPGLKKIGVLTPEIFATGFTWEIPDRFALWSKALEARWEMWPLNRITQLGLIFLAAAACRRLDGIKASAFLGSVLMFALTLPAHYYHVYFGPMAAVLLAPTRCPGSRQAGRGAPVQAPAGLSDWMPWLYLPWAASLQAGNIFYVAGGNEALLITGVSAALFFGFVLMSLGVLLRPRDALTVFAALVVVFSLSVEIRAHPLGNDAPPPAYGRGWTRVEFEPRDWARPMSCRFIDVHGYPIHDDALILLPGNHFTARFDAETAKRGEFLMRADHFYAGVLVVRVNGQEVARLHLSRLGTIFDYVRCPLPRNTIAKGANTLELMWTEGTDIAVFSTWLR